MWVMPEWSNGFPYFLQFKAEFGNKEISISLICLSEFIDISSSNLDSSLVATAEFYIYAGILSAVLS